MATYEIVAPLTIDTPHSVSAEAVLGPFILGDFLENWNAEVTTRLASPVILAEMSELWQSSVAESWVRTARADLAEVFTGRVVALVRTQSLSNIVGTFTCGLTARIATDNKALLLGDIARAVYALWGYDGIQNLGTITIGRERIAEWCNAAMQLIYSQADRLEYFNRERVTVTVGTVGSVALPSSVQRIQGEARIGGRSLRPLASKSQVSDFATLYGGSSPMGFLVESVRESGADSLGMTLYVAPAPSQDTDITLDVTYEPPRFESADLLSGQVIPLPHKWAETIFMPLVRKWAAGDGRMPASMRAAQIAEIDAQYAAARQMLGLADIDPVTVKDSKEGKASS
jgi:hypothetical protein